MSAWMKPLVTSVAYSWRRTSQYGLSRLRSISDGIACRPSTLIRTIAASSSAETGAPWVRSMSVCTVEGV